jgi:pilus assembly protein CpaB
MKGSKAIIVLFLALASGLAAMLLGARWMTGGNTPSADNVVIATQDISLGSVIQENMVKEVPWPSDSKPKGAFAKTPELVGRVVVSNVLSGEPLLDARLAPIGSKGGLSAVIPEGQRAITVKVNEVVGVAGFALPGSFVDIMIHTKDGEDESISKIVLERILVLAIAQEASRDETKPKVVNAVTLQVTPQEAEKIDLARGVGSLSLVLRNQTDQKTANTGSGMRTEDLLALKKRAPPSLAAPAPVTVAQAAPSKPKPKPLARPVQVVPEPAVAMPPPRIVAVEPKKERIEVIRGVQRSEADL